MLLSEIFDEHSIKLNLEANTKQAAFRELIETVADIHPELNKAEMFAVIQDRERKMSTAVTAGVAVPHGYYPDSSGIFGAIGISKDGIEYDTLDREPVHFIFLFVLGELARERHLRTLNQVLALIRSGKLASMRTAKDVREVRDILSQFR